MLTVTWHRVYISARQRILARSQYVEGLSENLTPSCLLHQNFDDALLDNYVCQCSYYRSQHATGVDLGGIPLSRAPQIFRRNTRFAGTVIRPDYQFLPRFGDQILGLAPLFLTHMFKQIKQTIITLMTMFKVNHHPPNKVPGAGLIGCNDAEHE